MELGLFFVSFVMLVWTFLYVIGGADSPTYEHFPEKYLVKNKTLLKLFLKSEKIQKNKTLNDIFRGDVRVTKYFAALYLLHLAAFFCVIILYIMHWSGIYSLSFLLHNNDFTIGYMFVSAFAMFIVGIFHIIMNQKYIEK